MKLHHWVHLALVGLKAQGQAQKLSLGLSFRHGGWFRRGFAESRAGNSQEQTYPFCFPTSAEIESTRRLHNCVGLEFLVPVQPAMKRGVPAEPLSFSPGTVIVAPKIKKKAFFMAACRQVAVFRGRDGGRAAQLRDFV